MHFHGRPRPPNFSLENIFFLYRKYFKMQFCVAYVVKMVFFQTNEFKHDEFLFIAGKIAQIEYLICMYLYIVFTGASLTTNSAARTENAVSGRNGGSLSRPNEEWPMRELVAKQSSHHSSHHPHHHHQVVHGTPPTVSLETHQTERGANTTIAATTHHLHEIDVSILHNSQSE